MKTETRKKVQAGAILIGLPGVALASIFLGGWALLILGPLVAVLAVDGEIR